MARLLGVPVFLYLLLGPHDDFAALIVLILAGISDWADGVLARKLNQYSRLGELLDPAADRLYIVATLVGLVLRDIIPWWLAAIIVGRDLVLAVALGVLRRYGYGPLPVHYLGKAATFNLLYAFPFLLLSARSGAAGVGLPTRGLGVHVVGHRAVPVGRRALPHPHLATGRLRAPWPPGLAEPAVTGSAAGDSPVDRPVDDGPEPARAGTPGPARPGTARCSTS